MLKKAQIMGMPVTVSVGDREVKEGDIEEIFNYLREVDERFSTYKDTSEVSQVNKGVLHVDNSSRELKKILKLCEETKKDTEGYFNCMYNSYFDPSGIVKGYAISEAAKMLDQKKFHNYFVEIAGDIQTSGMNQDQFWKVGIENPFNREEIVSVISLSGEAIATSGNYIKPNHIYNPVSSQLDSRLVSLSVVSNSIYDADRFATAAFAMGVSGFDFLTARNMACHIILSDHTCVTNIEFQKYQVL